MAVQLVLQVDQVLGDKPGAETPEQLSVPLPG